MPVLLLALFSVALIIGVGLIVALVKRSRAKRRPVEFPAGGPTEACPYEKSCLFPRPACWLAVKSRNVLAVKSALGLHNAKPCSWTDALVEDQKLFISPPVKGWILVMGSGLPEPSDDVDVCFRFLIKLSRCLGQVQFFSASRILNHHAWVKADAGRIVRAYAWAGVTLWHQGKRTPAERDLGLRCFDYTETHARVSFNQPDPCYLNAEKVPLLAARWSLDPGRLDATSLEAPHGIAGEPSRIY